MSLIAGFGGCKPEKLLSTTEITEENVAKKSGETATPVLFSFSFAASPVTFVFAANPVGHRRPSFGLSFPFICRPVSRTVAIR